MTGGDSWRVPGRLGLRRAEEGDEHKPEHVEGCQRRNYGAQNEQSEAVLRSAAPGCCPCCKKPLKGGTPAKRSVPAMKVQNVTGIFLRSPPMFQMSCS